jgi:ribulose 1,5-bisphosphate synthetase/thiazole synthase
MRCSNGNLRLPGIVVNAVPASGGAQTEAYTTGADHTLLRTSVDVSGAGHGGEVGAIVARVMSSFDHRSARGAGTMWNGVLT